MSEPTQIQSDTSMGPDWVHARDDDLITALLEAPVMAILLRCVMKAPQVRSLEEYSHIVNDLADFMNA